MDLITRRISAKDIGLPKWARKAIADHGLKYDDVQVIRKGINPEDTKFKDGERSSVDYITTKAVDRDGEIVVPNGAVLDHYRKNPVVLFGHDYKALPVGKSLWIKADDKGLISKTQYASAKANPKAEQIWNYRKEGFPMAKSIGFIPLEMVHREDFGDLDLKALGLEEKDLAGADVIYPKWLMLEYSDVPVPSNPEALELAISKGILSMDEAKKAAIEDSAFVLNIIEPEDKGLTVEAVDSSGNSVTVWANDKDDAPGDDEGEEKAMLKDRYGVDGDEPKPDGKPVVFELSEGDDELEVEIDNSVTDFPRTWPQFKSAEGAEGRWNKSLSKDFDVESVEAPPSSVFYKMASEWLECEVRNIFVHEEMIPGALMGTYLTGLEKSLKEFELIASRNFMPDGSESPPRYSVIQLTSERSSDFLISGMEFYGKKSEDGSVEERVIIRRRPSWGGIELTSYSTIEHKTSIKVFSAMHKWASENNFLKGERFALSGEFLKKTGDTWDSVFLTSENEKILKRTVALLNEKGADLPNRGLIAMGPPGCLHADTPIYDPIDGTTESVKGRWNSGTEFHVYSLADDGSIVITQAERPWKYEKADMVKLTFDDGRTISVTRGHRFWVGSNQEGIGRDGYATADEIVSCLDRFGPCAVLPSVSEASLRLLELQPCQPLSNSGFCLEAQRQGVPRSFDILQDLKGCYSACRHQCDERPPLSGGDGQEDLPLLVYVQERTPSVSHLGGLVSSDIDSHQVLYLHPSNLDYCDQIEPLIEAESVYPYQSGASGHGAYQPSSTWTPRQSNALENIGPLLPASYRCPNGMTCVAPVLLSKVTPDYILSSKVSKAEIIGEDNYYDFHVPGYENYWAVGMFHHNTGKTLSGRIIMNSTESTFIWISARDLMYSGASGGISYGFSLARELAPSVLFIEDIDNWLHDRATDLLKTEMDGISQSKGVVTILTSNHPERLPEALIDRPGRFHEILNFALPDASIRTKMLKAWATGITEKAADSLTLDTKGFSGAHMYELVKFAQTIAEEDDIDIADALVISLKKIKDQRELIDSVRGKKGISAEVSVDGDSIAEALLKNEDEIIFTDVSDGMYEISGNKIVKEIERKDFTSEEKSGRTLSKDTISTLKKVADGMEKAIDAIKDLVESVESSPEEPPADEVILEITESKEKELSMENSFENFDSSKVKDAITSVISGILSSQRIDIGKAVEDRLDKARGRIS